MGVINKLICFSMAFFLTMNSWAFNQTKIQHAINRGLNFLESVQLEYGEFPTLFFPNLPEPARSLKSSFDSNVFTTAMIADALHDINRPEVVRINRKAVGFIESQLLNKQGLWSYFTTHNAAPLYPNTIYDLDDTVFASMVLRQNKQPFPNNSALIKANKNDQNLYLTFIDPPFNNDVDCGVNANVLSYLQENDDAVCQYLNNQVATGKHCANYYSQMDAYYLLSRAYKSGVTCLAPSVPKMTQFALEQFKSEHGSVEHSAFKTAIALNILLDLDYYGSETEQATAYLMTSQSKISGSWPGEEFWLWAGTDDEGEPMLIGRSSSSALTTAIVLKALNRLNFIKIQP